MSDRFKAFFYHILCTSFVAILSLVVIFYVWFPNPLHKMLGVVSIFIMHLIVGAVMGPLLTLLVYNTKKKSLKFDLSCIVLLQVSAFIYGFYILSEGRPVWIVHAIDRFEIVQAYEVEAFDGVKADFASPSWSGPRWVGAKRPDDSAGRTELLFSALSGGADLAKRADLYVNYSIVSSDVSMRAISLSLLENFNDSANVSHVLEKWPDADAYLPLHSRTKNTQMTVLLQRETARVIAVVDLMPW